MLNNGKSYSRDKDPKRVDNRIEKLQKKAKKKKWKKVSWKSIGSEEEAELAKGVGVSTRRDKTIALKPTFGARRAARTLARIAKRQERKKK
jgi:hypothetical protein